MSEHPNALLVRDLFRVRRWAGRGVYELDDEQRRVLTPHH